MKKFCFFAVLTIILLATEMAVVGQSEVYKGTCVIAGKKISFGYIKTALAPKDWLTWVAEDMQSKAGNADWYMCTYSGGNIALTHRLGENYESFELSAPEVRSRVPYKDYYTVSLGMINAIVKSGETVVVSDSEDQLEKISAKLKLMSRYSQELIKVQKP
jgi:hypothetical protein